MFRRSFLEDKKEGLFFHRLLAELAEKILFEVLVYYNWGFRLFSSNPFENVGTLQTAHEGEDD